MSTKMKSKSGAGKRFHITGNGHVKFKHAKMRHIMCHKSQKVKRGLRKSALLCASDEKFIKKMLPYG